MIKRLITSILIICSFSIYNSSAQQFKQFSGKPENFTSEVFTFTSSVLDDDQEKNIKKFSIHWDSAHFTPEQKQLILDFSKCMVDKKARPVPDFYSFIAVLNIFQETKHSSTSFNSWLQGINALCIVKKTTLTSLLRLIDQANSLLTDNIIYKTPSLSWKPSSKNYYFNFKDELEIVFNETDLVCFSKRDSIKIFGATGKVKPVSSTFEGKKGLVTWERAEYNRGIISAKLTNYKIDLTKSSYEADSVVFTNKNYFDYNLVGRLEDNVTLIKRPEEAQFPRFDSYKKEFKIDNLYKNVNYKGGFSMQGAKLIGKGTKEEPARLEFYRRDTLRLLAKSVYFIFRPEKVLGLDASVTIFLEKDSIYHGDLQFTYTVKNNEVSLIKSENYTAQSPYMNSYHKLDMNFEQLRWRIDEPHILITTTPGSSIGKALFESLNFFNKEEYEKLQYYDEANPLISLRRYSKYIGSNKFSANSFAEYIKRPMHQVHTLLFPLAVEGYIFYDSSTEQIEIKNRLYDNISASAGRIDYDVVRFLSTTNAPLENASLDLRNNDLKLNGIPQVFVSDSQSVVIYPKDETILMKRNRSFQFDGVVSAGLFTYFGRNFFFHYDEFKINLKDVDSIRMKVITGTDNYGKPIFSYVNNVIEGVTGDVLIDKPDNKSGIKSNPEYPIFHSIGNSYVYYDDPKIQKGVYKRNRDFYFKIDPYTLDSLDNFTKEGMNFEGTFSSAKIFPDIPEKLVLQEDFSLGFKHKSPSSGFPLYVNKGNFKNIIHLSNQGLRGNGTVSYLTSTTNSPDFLFYPDSMNTEAPDFTIQASAAATQYPPVNGNNVAIHWMPYNDYMQIRNKEKPFRIFNDQTSHNGLLTLAPQGLTGSGTIDMTAAVSNSDKYKFGYTTIDADTSNFDLRSLHSASFAVSTTNVKAHIDFATRSGSFKSNDSKVVTEFPENKYMAQLDEFKWMMDKKELEMMSRRQQLSSNAGAKYGFKDEPLTGTVFTSTKKGQDSLSFVSPLATYDYQNDLLIAKKVKYIEVADARLFPKNEILTIEADAKMRTLEDAKIMANTETRFHNIYGAQAIIEGKYLYNANGKYDYVDENNKIQTIYFHEITVDTAKVTIATGDITEPDDFTLSPAFSYIGKAKLRAPEKVLTFDGAVQIKQACPYYSTSWVKFNAPIDPIDIRIPISDKPAELNNHPIVLGTLITTDSIHVYSSFFGLKKNHLDSTISKSSGELRYIKDSATYVIGKPEKLKNPQLPGEMIALNTQKCFHYDEGPFNLGIELGQMKTAVAGVITHNLPKNDIRMRVSIGFDFYMYDKSMEYMAIMVDSLTGKTPVDITQPFFKETFGNFVEPDKLNKFYDEIKTTGKLKDVPGAMASSIFLNDVTLQWDDVSNSFRSIGKIGIGFVNKRLINDYVEGYIEIWRKRSGNICDIYLKIDENNYYYFGYTRGTMQVLSNDKNFTQPIKELSDGDRTLKVGRGQTPYTFLVSTDRKMQLVKARWLNRGAQPEEAEPDNEPALEPAKQEEENTPEKPKENAQ